MNRTRDVQRHHRERVIQRRLRDWSITSSPDAVTGEVWTPIPGTMAKKHPFDCGKPRCRVCQRPRYGKSERRQNRVIKDIS